jgi:tetratricopeptide (TPR) repeat protein
VLGWAYHGLRQDAQAIAALEQARALAREAGRRAVEALALAYLGQVYQKRGQDEHALAALEQALTIRRELGTRNGVGATLDALGRVYAAQGQDDRARAAYEEALVAAREEGDRDGEGQVFGSLMTLWRAAAAAPGNLLRQTGDPRVSGDPGATPAPRRRAAREFPHGQRACLS